MVPVLATDSREVSARQSEPEGHKCRSVKLSDRTDPGKPHTRAFSEAFYKTSRLKPLQKECLETFDWRVNQIMPADETVGL